jgi:hypothetical protein
MEARERVERSNQCFAGTSLGRLGSEPCCRLVSRILTAQSLRGFLLWPQYPIGMAPSTGFKPATF